MVKTNAIVALATIGSVSAFVAPKLPKTNSILRMSEPVTTEADAPAAETTVMETTRVDETDRLPKMSQSIPFMERPSALTGALAGDVGFDPLGFSKTTQDLMYYREAEIKHSRLAMLAAAGWPLAEVFDRKIATAFNLPVAVDINDRVPSVLNGGLGKISPLYWILCIAMAAAIDIYGSSKVERNNPDYLPGNIGFDPFGLYPSDVEGKRRMETCEITHGRTAMLAITAFAFQEFVSKEGVVNETPLFFFPIMQTLHQYANSGYIN